MSTPFQGVGTLNAGVSTAVAGVAVQILAATATCRAVIIQNTGANSVAIGVAGVTASTGFVLPANGIIVLDNPPPTAVALYAIQLTAASTVLVQLIT